MAAKDLAKRVQEAEYWREIGKTELALGILDDVIREARLLEDTATLASALGHRIVCNKHLFQLSQGTEPKYRLRMEEDIRDGLRLPLSLAEKKVLYLRRGDTFMMVDNFAEAERWYEGACQCLPHDSQEAPEYFGHLAEAKTGLGDYDEALDMLDQALKLLSVCRDLRSFHRHIIASGLYARQLNAARKAGKNRLAIAAFCKGYSRAIWLAWRHGMPQRFNQYNAEIKRRLQATSH